MRIFVRLHNYLNNLSKYDFLGLFLLRLYLFYIFWSKGTVKLSKLDEFSWNFDGLSSTFMELGNWLLTTTEIICAISLLVGLFVRWSALLLIIIISFTAFTISWESGWKPELDNIEMLAIYLIMLATLVFSGGGKYYSLDYWVSR
tara:strand:- start:240 stop:674 length:435 start_codon:yes stop_codon:yes gene_type:complete